jgi:hypothetical protein
VQGLSLHHHTPFPIKPLHHQRHSKRSPRLLFPERALSVAKYVSRWAPILAGLFSLSTLGVLVPGLGQHRSQIHPRRNQLRISLPDSTRVSEASAPPAFSAASVRTHWPCTVMRQDRVYIHSSWAVSISIHTNPTSLPHHFPATLPFDS